MRAKPTRWIEQHRIQAPGYLSPEGGNNGAFRVPLPTGETMRVIASDGRGWDHVSVSLDARCPTWQEMSQVKEVFWTGEETVVQFHPATSKYVNHHLFCLHLWRCQDAATPIPPLECV